MEYREITDAKYDRQGFCEKKSIHAKKTVIPRLDKGFLQGPHAGGL